MAQGGAVPQWPRDRQKSRYFVLHGHSKLRQKLTIVKFIFMSVVQLKEQLTDLSEADLLEVAFHISILLDSKSPERSSEIARRMENGDYVHQDEVLAIHNKLVDEGR